MKHYYEKIHGWFNFKEAYDQIVARLPADRPSFIVELGCWKGKSTAYLGVEIINSKKPITLIAIDHFVGSVELMNEPELDRLREIFDVNLLPVENELQGRFIVWQGDSAHAASDYPDGTIDVVWVDASHVYKDVLADITAWWPKLREGGIMGGDDIHVGDVSRAVSEFFGSNHAHDGWWWIEKPLNAGADRA